MEWAKQITKCDDLSPYLKVLKIKLPKFRFIDECRRHSVLRSSHDGCKCKEDEHKLRPSSEFCRRYHKNRTLKNFAYSLLEAETDETLLYIGHKAYQLWLIKYFADQHIDISWILSYRHANCSAIGDSSEKVPKGEILYQGECSLDPFPLPDSPNGYAYHWAIVDKIKKQFRSEFTLKRLEWRFLRVTRTPNHSRWIRTLTRSQCKELNQAITLGDIIADCQLPPMMIAEIGLILYYRAKSKLTYDSKDMETTLFKAWSLSDKDSLVILANQCLTNGEYQTIDLLNMVEARIKNHAEIKRHLREIAVETR